MALRYLLDTNICIYIGRQRPPHLRAKLDSLEPRSAAISVITYGELAYGAEGSMARERALSDLERMIGHIKALPVPVEAGQAYGAIRYALSRSGNIIGPNDLWIAAHAIASDLTLVTNNEREFQRIAGLKIENWTK